MNATFLDNLLVKLQTIGQELLRLQKSPELRVEFKADASPKSNADEYSHTELMAFFDSQNMSDPIISEEGNLEHLEDYGAYWIIDPLDGTREYIAGTPEFSICMAHVTQGKPDFAVIYAPYYQKAIGVDFNRDVFCWEHRQLSLVSAPVVSKKPYVIVSNFSYEKPRLDRFISVLEESDLLGKVERRSQSSAIKFMLLAEGQVHLYPKLGRIMQWDMAAGMCICEALGIPVTDLSGKSISLSSKQMDQFGFFMGDYQPEFTQIYQGLA